MIQVPHGIMKAIEKKIAIETVCRESFLDWLVVTFPSARTAENLFLAANFAAEVDAFSAGFAGYALAFVSRKLFWWQFDLHPLHREKVVVGYFAVGQHLLLVLVCNLRMHLASQSFGRFFRCDADGF